MNAKTVTYDVTFGKAEPPAPAVKGRVPRVAKLMALAHRIDELIRDGVALDYAEVASLGEVSRARITQIMNLLLLAPDIQEALLFMEAVVEGRDPIIIRNLQPLAAQPNWERQREMWRELMSPTAEPAAK